MKNLVLAAMFLMASWQSPAAAARYIVTDLGTLGGDESEAFAINDHGQVVGSSYTSDGALHGFVYTNGAMTDIGVLTGGTRSEAQGINNAGQIVGYSVDARSQPVPFLYSGGSMAPIGSQSGTADAINDAGQFVGTVLLPNGPFTSDYRAFTCNGHACSLLGATPATGGSIATAINEAGSIVGTAYMMAGVSHAVLFSGGTTTDLGTLAGNFSEAHDINAAGQVVGVSSSADGMEHAFIYTGGALRDLGTFGGPFDYSAAYGINDLGQVVGSASLADMDIGFLYEGGALINLNDLIDPRSGFFLTGARGINASGQIVGVGYGSAVSSVDGDGLEHAFLLTPIVGPPAGAVPEPATWAIMVIGFGGIGAALRWRGARHFAPRSR